MHTRTHAHTHTHMSSYVDVDSFCSLIDFQKNLFNFEADTDTLPQAIVANGCLMPPISFSISGSSNYRLMAKLSPMAVRGVYGKQGGDAHNSCSPHSIFTYSKWPRANPLHALMGPNLPVFLRESIVVSLLMIHCMTYGSALNTYLSAIMIYWTPPPS